MPAPKNSKPVADQSDALLSALAPSIPAAKPEPEPAAVPKPEPVAPVAEVEDAGAIIDELTTPGDLIKALIDALGHDANLVASVEIRRQGFVRVVGTDRALRSHRFTWPENSEAAE